MEFNLFVRRPFSVEAVEITNDNIEGLAPFIGELKTKDNGQKFIQVDRRLVPNIYRVYPGFWMTRMGDNVRCYAKKVFREQFTEMTSEIEEWTEYLRASTTEDLSEIPQPEPVEVNVFSDRDPQPTDIGPVIQ